MISRLRTAYCHFCYCQRVRRPGIYQLELKHYGLIVKHSDTTEERRSKRHVYCESFVVYRGMTGSRPPDRTERQPGGVSPAIITSNQLQ